MSTKLTGPQLTALAQQLGGIAAIFNPAAAASIQGLLLIFNQLREGLGAIRDNDPAMWAKVSQNWKDAVAAFEASTGSTP